MNRFTLYVLIQVACYLSKYSRKFLYNYFSVTYVIHSFMVILQYNLELIQLKTQFNAIGTVVEK